MEENLKIISDGSGYEVYLYGKLLYGVRSVDFSAAIGDIPVVSLNMFIDSNNNLKKEETKSIDEIVKWKLESLRFPDVKGSNTIYAIEMYNGLEADLAHQIFHHLCSLKEQGVVLNIKDRLLTIKAVGFDGPEASCKDDNYAVMMTGEVLINEQV